MLSQKASPVKGGLFQIIDAQILADALLARQLVKDLLGVCCAAPAEVQGFENLRGREPHWGFDQQERGV